MTDFFATTPSYGHPSSPEEGTALGVAPLLSEGSGEAPPLPFREGLGVGFTYSSP